MTGKQLKEFAAKIHDESIVTVRERYGDFQPQFEMKASLVCEVASVDESKDVPA